jgi:hypothetical protein
MDSLGPAGAEELQRELSSNESLSKSLRHTLSVSYEMTQECATQLSLASVFLIKNELSEIKTSPRNSALQFTSLNFLLLALSKKTKFSKYFRLCGPHDLWCNYSSLPLWFESSHRGEKTNGLKSVPIKLYGYLACGSHGCDLRHHNKQTNFMGLGCGPVVERVQIYIFYFSVLWIEPRAFHTLNTKVHAQPRDYTIGQVPESQT